MCLILHRLASRFESSSSIHSQSAGNGEVVRYDGTPAIICIVIIFNAIGKKESLDGPLCPHLRPGGSNRTYPAQAIFRKRFPLDTGLVPIGDVIRIQ